MQRLQSIVWGSPSVLKVRHPTRVRDGSVLQVCRLRLLLLSLVRQPLCLLHYDATSALLLATESLGHDRFVGALLSDEYVHIRAVEHLLLLVLMAILMGRDDERLVVLAQLLYHSALLGRIHALGWAPACRGQRLAWRLAQVNVLATGQSVLLVRQPLRGGLHREF